MSTVFEDRLNAVGHPVGERFNVETVTFTDDVYSDLELTALVELDEPIRDHAEGFTATIYTGVLLVDAAGRTAILNSGNPYKQVTVKDHSDWHVTDVGDVINGKASVGIRREIAEHSNAIDLQGNQHRYG